MLIVSIFIYEYAAYVYMYICVCLCVCLHYFISLVEALYKCFERNITPREGMRCSDVGIQYLVLPFAV